MLAFRAFKQEKCLVHCICFCLHVEGLAWNVATYYANGEASDAFAKQRDDALKELESIEKLKTKVCFL